MPDDVPVPTDQPDRAQIRGENRKQITLLYGCLTLSQQSLITGSIAKFNDLPKGSCSLFWIRGFVGQHRLKERLWQVLSYSVHITLR